ncbi:MAG: hypothetical protein QNJ04_12830 [Desulfobacterales bacterium]|nr:hypothetical protein [Desulfobacterales bacterium]
MDTTSVKEKAGFQPLRRIYGMALFPRAVIPFAVVGLLVPGMSIAAVFSRLWIQAKISLALILVWLGRASVGILGRIQYRLTMVLRLMRGQPAEGVWQAF